MFNQFKDINRLRQQAKRLKKELGQEKFIGTTLEGKIQITMDGNQEVQAVHIDRELLKAQAQETLEKGVREAMTQCLVQMRMLMARKLQDGGLF